MKTQTNSLISLLTKPKSLHLFKVIFFGQLIKKISSYLLLVIGFLFLQMQMPFAQSFVHPGLLHKQSDLDRMKARVAEGAQPWKSSWDILVANSHSSLTRPVSTVPSIIYRGFDGTHPENYALLFRDAASAYATALRWQISGDVAYAEKSIQILNAWAAGLTTISGTSDKFLLAGIQGYQLANAAEIMRLYSGWAAADFAKFQNWMLNVFYTMNKDFLQNHNGACISHYWANWDLCNMASMLSIGVLCDRRDIYDDAVNYFKTGAGNGAIQKLVPYVHDQLAQLQESGRDQGHALLCVGLAASFCEMAWNQGDDLYSYDDNRLFKAFEYVAKYNLGYQVPYTTYSNCTGIVQTIVSADGRGNVRPVWELVYNHYVKRKGLSAPYINLFAQRVRPEGGGGNYGPNSGGYDQLGYGTLTATLEAPSKPNNQTISFPPIANKDFGAPDFDPGATASSGLPVVYSVLDPNVVSVNTDGTIRVIKPGTTIVYAQQSGNELYNEAPIVQQTITVNKIPGTNDGTWSNTTGTVTAALSSTSGSPDLSWTGQSFTVGDHVRLTGTVAGGFTTNTSYNVVAVSGNTFQLALQPGGTPILATTTITNGTAQRYQKWLTATNWSGSVVPGGVNATAIFGSTSFSNIAGVTLDDNIKIGTLSYAANGSSELVLASGSNNGMLTFETISGTPRLIMVNTGTRKLFLGNAINNSRIPLKIAGTQGLTINTPVYGGGNPAALRIQAAMNWSNFSGGLTLEQGTIELHNTTGSLTAADNVLLPQQRLTMGTGNIAVIYFAGSSAHSSKQTIGALDGTDAAFIFTKSNITNGVATLVVGADNGDGNFEGTIGIGPILTNTADQGRINLEKIGTGMQIISGTIKNSPSGSIAVTIKGGRLILNGANEYQGATTVIGGILEINGSGVSPILVNAGTLSGSGNSSADIMIGTGTGSGASFAPGNSVGGFITTGSLSLRSDATCAIEFNSEMGKFDKITANGVTLDNAMLSLTDLGNDVFVSGDVSNTIIDNTGSLPVSGTFQNLAEGDTITAGSNSYIISYQGGTSNDVTLTAIKKEQAIAFNPIENKGIVGADFDPGAVASSGLPVSYSSSNTAVATIVDGKIHLSGIGTTIITAAQDGNAIYKAATPVSQTLVVFDNVAPSVPQALTAAKRSDGKVQLLWQASSDNVGVTGYFVFLNGIQLNADAVAGTGYITDAPSGSTIHIYTVIAADAEGNLSDESAPEIFYNSNGNGSPSQGMEVLKVFPNPSDGNFKVRLNSKQTGRLMISVYNSSGPIVYQSEDTKSGDFYQKEIKLQNVPPGTYYVQVVVGDFNATKTILIQ